VYHDTFSLAKDGVIGRPACGWLEKWGVALQVDGGNEVRVCNGLKHQKDKRNMEYFAGLDVSVKERASALWMIRGRSCVQVASKSAGADDPAYYFNATILTMIKL
jgi:hypothetical protein